MGQDARESSLSALSGMKLYGLTVSYFTGKLEAYLRYCGLDYVFAPLDARGFRRVARATGMAQMPALELVDGRWMTDTTAIIEWIETQRDGASVIPRDPEQAFFSRVLEDFADEWLWRPALHYRWSYPRDARALGTLLARDMLRDVPAPLFLKRAFVIRRQRAKYLTGDGVTASTRPHIERLYHDVLAWMESALIDRDFLLGGLPTLADFGFMGPMFRHFSQDPTPSEIMRREAPRTWAWVARMWAATEADLADRRLERGVPGTWDVLLSGMVRSYFRYLSANAKAHQDGLVGFEFDLDGLTYELPVNLHRVYALKRLQTAYAALPPDAANAARRRLAEAEAWAPFWNTPYPNSGFDPLGRLPFLSPECAWGAPPRGGRGLAHDGRGR